MTRRARGPRRVDFSDRVRRVLQEADRAIAASPREDPLTVYAACRVAMEILAPVDTFYIALVRERDRTTAFPYTVDGGKVLVPDVLPYGPRGLTAWMLASRRTYRYSDDKGALVARGHYFGDPVEQDQDAIVTPLFTGPDRDLIGFMAVLSVRAGVFDEVHVAAFEWLATAAGYALTAHEQARQGLDLAAVYGPDQRAGAITQAELANFVIGELEQIRIALSQLGTGAPTDLVESLRDRCQRLQSTVAVMVGQPEKDPLAGLTEREREVVELITGAQDPGNRAIAATLGLSETTVKTHVGHVLAKLGLKRRSELRWLLGQVTAAQSGPTPTGARTTPRPRSMS